MRLKTLLVVVILAVLAVIAITGVTILNNQRPVTEVTVTHGVVKATSTTGTGLGTVRTFFIPIQVDGISAEEQYLSGTLTTLGEGVKGDQELRGSNLVFVFGGEANQLVVGGISLYPPAGATLAIGEETVRPVIGGSGTYEGATGEVVSTNFGDEGWSHVFRVTTG
jgi:hypothetical protein